jgi:hypothetical protein
MPEIDSGECGHGKKTNFVLKTHNSGIKAVGFALLARFPLGK